MPQVLYTVQLNYMHVQRKKSVADKAKFAALSELPDIMVPKLMADNYEIFTTAFCYLIERTIGMNSISIYYFNFHDQRDRKSVVELGTLS